MWKKKVEAGILLYALLMVAIFSLVLAFYLNRQVATQRNLVLEREKVTAYALATLSKKESVTANIGTSQTQTEGDMTKVAVDLKTGRSYQFTFPKGKAEEKKEEKVKGTEKESMQEEKGKSKEVQKWGEKDQDKQTVNGGVKENVGNQENLDSVKVDKEAAERE